MKLFYSTTIALTLAGVVILVLAPTRSSAASWVTQLLDGQEIIPEGCRAGPQPAPPAADFSGPILYKSCGIPEIIQTAINITRIILGMMGSVALLMFTYGGVMFIISSGNRDRVEKAKTILTNATWGLIIILLAWSIINFTVLAISGGDYNKGATIFDHQPTTNPPK